MSVGKHIVEHAILGVPEVCPLSSQSGIVTESWIGSGEIYPYHLYAIGNPTSGEVPAYDPLTGGFTWTTNPGELIEPHEYSFTCTSGTLSYMLDFAPASQEGTLVTVNGIVMSSDDYEIYGANIIFQSGAIEVDDNVFVKELVSWVSIERWNTPSGVVVDPSEYTFATTSGELDYYLDFIPRTKESILVLANGQALHPDDYSLDGELLTFGSGVIEADDEIVVKSLTMSTVITQIDAESIQAPINIYHDGEDGHIVNYSGELYIDTVHPSGGVSSGCIRSHGKIYNAVWNDYADYWPAAPHTERAPGFCYADYGQGVHFPKKKADKCAIGICSDTYGHAVGDMPGRIPIGVAGFVLAHVDKQYSPGTLLTTLPGGVLTRASWYNVCMRREIGKYIRPEPREFYNGVPVNGRHWVKVL